MKIKIIDEVVYAVAESQAEALQLVKLVGSETKEPVEKKHHKKHKFKKECEVCHKNFKGLGIHLRKTHGVVSVHKAPVESQLA